MEPRNAIKDVGDPTLCAVGLSPTHCSEALRFIMT
jgi:hypothetical protein